MAHHAALAPNSPDGSLPAAKVALQNAMDLLAFTASLPGPPDHLVSRKSLGWSPTPNTLCHPPSASSHRGEGQLQLCLHPR